MDDLFVDGREAERLLNDPTFQKALARLEKKYVDTWKLEKNAATREHLHACVKALEGIQGELRIMVESKELTEASDRRLGKPKR